MIQVDQRTLEKIHGELSYGAGNYMKGINKSGTETMAEKDLFIWLDLENLLISVLNLEKK